MIEFTDADGVKQTLDTSKPFNVAYHVDCMELLRSLPDKCFDLACVDPPYGDANVENDIEHRNQRGRFDRYNDSSQIVQVERERERETEGSDSTEVRRTRTTDGRGTAWNRFGGWFDRYKTPVERIGGGQNDLILLQEQAAHWQQSMPKKIIAWDVAPKKEYFEELFRVSRHAIIFGGNYFALPPTRCFLVWRKLTISENFSMAMAEYAWTNFNSNAKVFEYAPQGEKGEPRFHATQKPIALYEWVYKHFANKGDKILDTHLGSQSSRIAAYRAGLNFCGCEIDDTYYLLGQERFENHTAQQRLF